MNPDFCVRQCPFLAKVAEQNGLEYARDIAIDPTLAAGHQLPHGDINSKTAASFGLFHGPEGIVPLVQKPKAGSGCPFHAQLAAAPQCSEDQASSSKPLTRPLPLATISLSFGSGPNFGDFLRNKINKHGSGSKRPNNNNRQHPQQSASSSSSQAPNGPGSSQHPASNPSSNPGSFKPQRPLTDPTGSGLGTSGSGLGPTQRGFGPGYGPQPPSASSASTAHPAGGPSNGSISSSRGWSTLGSNSSTGSISSSTGGSSGLGSASSSPSSFKASSNSRASGSWQGSAPTQNPKGHNGARAPGGLGGSRVAGGSVSANGPAPAPCPLRKWLGPVAGLVFNEYDKIVCPPAIVAARAALSRTAAVQQLRPQKLPVKLVAVAAVAAATNMPCGAVREHFEKFSVGWFIAIHATIPFVAMLRKAVIMPKYAMLVTFGAAILGQVIGSRLERARLQQLQQQGLADPLLALTEPFNRLMAPAAAVPAPVCIAAGQDGNSSNSSRPARGAGWQHKLIAGVQAGLGGGEKAAAAAAAGACSTEVVGLGSCLPQLPIVRG